jgi:hypothetical protein
LSTTLGDLGGGEAGGCGEIEVLALERLARLQAQVCGEHFACLLIDREADATREEPDRRERGHRNQQREHEHPQLARLAVAEQSEQSEPQCLDHATSLPASMLMMRPQRRAMAWS